MRRSIDTSIWADPWFEGLDPAKKLVFIYLITNQKTNMLGIYESSTKKIAFECDLDRSEVEDTLQKFENDKKIRRHGHFIILHNFLKHQKYNTNMKKSAIAVYNQLPHEVRGGGSLIDISDIDTAWSMLVEALYNHNGALRNHNVMVPKVEVEVEVESEIEVEVEVEKEIETKGESPIGEGDFSPSDYGADNFKHHLVEYITAKNENYRFTSGEKNYLWDLYEKISHGFKNQGLTMSRQALFDTLDRLYARAGFYQKMFSGVKALASNFDAIVGCAQAPSQKYDPVQNLDEYAQMIAGLE